MQDKEKQKSHLEVGGVSEVQREVLSGVIFQAFRDPTKALKALTIGIL